MSAPARVMPFPSVQRQVALPSRDDALRADVLRSHGADDTAAAELLAYGASAFDERTLIDPPPLPLADEPFVPVWEEYRADAGREGVVASLARRLVQLRFPVEPGMSARAEYQAATRRGRLDGAPATGLQLARPDGVRLFLHPTAAGRVPVIVAAEREDFVLLLQALTGRNEPTPIPASMGACIVGGYNNWDRVRRLRAEWARSTDDPSDEAWGVAFKSLSARKELYQDRFIILSSGPYSGTPAAAVGLPEDEWLRLSGAIRLDHECTHYFTRRVFGSMRNTLLDELCADYAGLVAACGSFRVDWFLHFMGLEDAHRYRPGARLENYRGTPPLSDAAFAVLQRLVRSAAAHLGEFDGAARAASAGAGPPAGLVVVALARMGLEALASEAGTDLLGEQVRDLQART